MQVIYVDNHILVVVKPAGMSVQPHEEGKESLLDLAKAWIKREYNKPGAVFLEPIHRLDQPVSGLVLFARTSKALSRLQEQMREKKIHKTYLATIEGAPPEEKGVLEHFLVHGDHRALVVRSGKKARLSYKVVKKSVGTTQVKIVLETGRYHQIRAQFAHIGCPIVGDKKYGSRLNTEKEGIALCHVEMQLMHPVTQKPLLFSLE